MLMAQWPCGDGADEFALVFDRKRTNRLLVVPALFDEGNKLRHFTVEVMRHLDLAGIDTFLPDLSGMNESSAPLESQSLESWQQDARAVARYFTATHVLTIRGGALIAPDHLPHVAYAPIAGTSLLRAMLRAQIIAAKEAGIADTRDALTERARTNGAVLAGHALGPGMFRELQEAEIPVAAARIDQPAVGGPALWLRAEPDHDPQQSESLARLVAEQLP